MKCPYNGFKECIVEKCPSCNYKENKRTVINGRYPPCMSSADAIDEGFAWEAIETRYEFVSCKLVDNNVQPIPPKKEEIHTVNKTNIVVHKSIF